MSRSSRIRNGTISNWRPEKYMQLHLFVYVPRPFRTWTIMYQHNFLSCVALRIFYFFSIFSKPCTASHLQKLIRYVALCFHCPFYPQYILYVSNSPTLLSSLIVPKMSTIFFWFFIHVPFCFFIFLKNSSSLTCSLHGIFHILLWKHFFVVSSLVSSTLRG